MKNIYRATLDLIAQWPDEKFNRLEPCMKQEFNPVDFQYVIDRRKTISAYNETHPRTTGFTLIKRPFRSNV